MCASLNLQSEKSWKKNQPKTSFLKFSDPSPFGLSAQSKLRTPWLGFLHFSGMEKYNADVTILFFYSSISLNSLWVD